MFYSSLNDEHITQKQSKHEKKVWKKKVGEKWEIIMICIEKRIFFFVDDS